MVYIAINDHAYMVATGESDSQPMIIDTLKKFRDTIPDFDWATQSDWRTACEKYTPKQLGENPELLALYGEIEAYFEEQERLSQEISDENWLMEKAHHAMAWGNNSL